LGRSSNTNPPSKFSTGTSCGDCPCCICYSAEWRGVVKQGNASVWDYLRYQASIACAASKLQTTKTEAAHTGPLALGSKSSDRQTIPLCGTQHHREGKFSYHKLGEKLFEEYHNLDIAAIVRLLNDEYDSGSQNTTRRKRIKCHA
jgi:hypothetical protein